MRYLIAGGGTSGHVNPAIAIAQALREKDAAAQILFVGTAAKIEATLVPKADFEIRFIDVVGLSRSLSPAGIKKNCSAILKYGKAKKQLRRLMRDFRPDVAIGTGGYVSAPVISEACRSGVKTLILEENAFAGVTTKMLAAKVDRVLLNLELTKPLKVDAAKVRVVGNPARPEFLTADRAESRRALGIGADEKVVLSCGGSLGAKCINDAFCTMARLAARDGALTLYHSASREYGSVLERVGDLAQNPKIRIFEYIYNMAQVMAAADVVVSRSGATTLTELSALGRASVLIPSPYVAENHQYFNAKALADAGAAELVEEKDLTGEGLYRTVCEIALNPERREKMERAAKSLYNASALDDICAEIFALAGRK